MVTSHLLQTEGTQLDARVLSIDPAGAARDESDPAEVTALRSEGAKPASAMLTVIYSISVFHSGT